MQYSLSLLHTLCSFSLSHRKAKSRSSLSNAAWLGCYYSLLLQLMESTWGRSALAVAESHNFSELICLCTCGFTESGAGSSSSQQPQPMADWRLRDTLVVSSVAIIDQCTGPDDWNRTLLHSSLQTLRSWSQQTFWKVYFLLLKTLPRHTGGNLFWYRQCTLAKNISEHHLSNNCVSSFDQKKTFLIFHIKIFSLHANPIPSNCMNAEIVPNAV